MEDQRLAELHDERSSPFHEAQQLLKLAEDLQAKCESLEDRHRLNFLVLYSMTPLLIFMDWFFATYISHSNTYSLVYSILTFAGLLLAFLQWYRMISRSRKLLLREKRALHRVVDLLREIEGPLTSTLSTLERAEFRVRLSRLDIGPGGP
jgi:hypothetical protein